MDVTETAENGAKSNIVVSVHSKSENAGKLVHKRKFPAPMRDSKLLIETMRKLIGTIEQNRTSKLFTAECIQNWSETIVVDGWQDLHWETLLVDTKQVLEEEIHLVMSEHSIVQTEEKLDYTMTETRIVQRSITFSLGKQTSEESSVHLELLQECAEVIIVQQDA